ncbi:MAG: ATP-dependent DNA helicase RecG [Candidatus Hydrogenedentes bacterium]|nr:ATP-dependent DNA helicase RecG [Candidatus Hydrogenedentota bacterium]
MEKDLPTAAPAPQAEAVSLSSPVSALEGIGPKRAALLEQLGLRTLGDLLFHFPREYRDYRQITPIAEVRQGELATVEAEIIGMRHVRLPRRQSLAHLTLQDATGTMSATFFGRGFLVGTVFVKGARGLFTGKVSEYKGPCLANPEYELLTGDEEDLLNTGRLVPVYPAAEGLTQRMLRRWVRALLPLAAPLAAEALPGKLRARHGLPGMEEALREVHFPGSPENAASARRRLAFEELLVLQADILERRQSLRRESRAHPNRINGPLLKGLHRRLPFVLTGAQERAVSDIVSDMASPVPMLRLIQGDVGCGKTLVALHAVAVAADGGAQTAFMAPTEILAEQHAASLRELLEPMGLTVAVLTGNTPDSRRIRELVAGGGVDVVVGTHALFQESTRFKRLGLAVIDEQHRFGVCQRALLSAKGPRPDVLQMTATPIPRSLALTVFGEMDLTVIDEMPPGRQPVKTRRIPESKLPDLYRHIGKEAGLGRQTYIVCPLVEESAHRGGQTAVLRHFQELSEGPLAGVPAAVLHGRMCQEEKDAVLRAFRRGEVRVLFSTTVIEVGIDVPRATMMVIENAAEFGLTQLHQLRGRVGRGSETSYCFLLGKPKTPEGRERLEILCEHGSGFDIAEADLRLRGPGEVFGARQAGISDLRLADLILDARLLDLARREAAALIGKPKELNALRGSPFFGMQRQIQSA